MSNLTVRRLGIDLDTPLPRHWNGGCAFRTAFFDALSMSFPAGEQIFIDSVRIGVAQLAPEQRERFAAEVQAFIGQEATHRHVHARYNAHLAQRGLVNRWEQRILRRRRELEDSGMGPRNWLAMTAATEHITAIFSEHLLAHADALLAGAEPRLRDLWMWHCSEETEHRSTAFELYRAIGGNDDWRLRIFRVVSAHFIIDVLRQTASNLWHDGSWWKPAVWWRGLQFLFGRPGLLRHVYAPWKSYRRADFHPEQADGSAATAWLAAHAELAPPVRQPA